MSVPTLQERFIGRLAGELLHSRCTQDIRRIWGAAATASDDILCSCRSASGLRFVTACTHVASVYAYVRGLTQRVCACSGVHDPVRWDAGQEACSQAEAAFCAVNGL